MNVGIIQETIKYPQRYAEGLFVLLTDVAWKDKCDETNDNQLHNKYGDRPSVRNRGDSVRNHLISLFQLLRFSTDAGASIEIPSSGFSPAVLAISSRSMGHDNVIVKSAKNAICCLLCPQNKIFQRNDSAVKAQSK